MDSKDSPAHDYRIFFVPGPEGTFLTWAKKLSLYQIVNSTAAIKNEAHEQKISSQKHAQLVRLITDPPSQIRSLTVQPGNFSGSGSGSGDTGRLAVGQASGRISVIGFQGSTKSQGDDRQYVTVKELLPRSPRVCHDLQWNPFPGQRNYLVAGFERTRQDSGILIFDTSREPSVVSSSALSR